VGQRDWRALPGGAPTAPPGGAAWTFGFVWLRFFLRLDPLNARARAGPRASKPGGEATGASPRWLLAGLVYGLRWELWTYGGLAKSKYAGVPVFPSVKLFEMPHAGYLGFPAFALEVFTMYHFVRPRKAFGRPTAA